MNIRLDSGYHITADSRQYILKRRVGDQNVIEGYFSSLQSLFQHYFDLLVRISDVQSIKQLLEKQGSIIKRIEELLKPLNIQLSVTVSDIKNKI